MISKVAGLSNFRYLCALLTLYDCGGNVAEKGFNGSVSLLLSRAELPNVPVYHAQAAVKPTRVLSRAEYPRDY